MEYRKAVEVENLQENAKVVLQSIQGLSSEDAMNALGAAVTHVAKGAWSEPLPVLDGWYDMVRSFFD